MNDDAARQQALPDDVRRALEAKSRVETVSGLISFGLDDDPDFDRLTELAASIFDVHLALITLIDTERQWFKSCLGVDLREMPVGMSFCAHAVAAGDDVMVVPDATKDPRFAKNPLVTGSQDVRFYAGAPISVNGERVGTLCVLDRVARDAPAPAQIKQLKLLAGLAASLFVLKESNRTGALARVALAREEKRRAVALSAASLASWVWDVRSGRIECDEELPQLFGLAPAKFVKTRQIFKMIDSRDLKKTETTVRGAFADDDDYFGEFRVRHSAPPRWIASRGRVVERGPDGRPLLVFGVSYDISDRKGAEERQRLLLRELNHRVKNTLATVQALATQTVRHAREPRAFLDAFGARLQALGQAHGLLSDREWRGIGLTELARLEVGPFDDRNRPRIHISGDDTTLSPDQALGLGLVLHELASNALSYGSLSVPDGAVDLAWKVRETGGERQLVLTWRERGGPKVEQPDRMGFGTILIRRSLAKIISSAVTHEFRPEGVYAEITLPLEAGAD